MHASKDHEKIFFNYFLSKPNYLKIIKPGFFSNIDLDYVGKLAKTFYLKFGESPSKEQMKALLSDDPSNISPDIVSSIYNINLAEYDQDWLKRKLKVAEIGEKFDVVVPVPLSFYRENWRGFNQAALLARVLGSQFSDLRLEKLLVRERNTVQQVKMKTREDQSLGRTILICMIMWIRGKELLGAGCWLLVASLSPEPAEGLDSGYWFLV